MTTFKQREVANKSPDTMGDTYEFLKLDLDEFIAYVDGLTEPVCREVGPVAMFLDATRPDHYWYVVPDRIYFTSNVTEYYALDERKILSINGISHMIPAGTITTHLQPNKFSETQKWVKKVEELVLAYSQGTSIDPKLIRAWIKQATGK